MDAERELLGKLLKLRGELKDMVNQVKGGVVRDYAAMKRLEQALDAVNQKICGVCTGGGSPRV